MKFFLPLVRVLAGACMVAAVALVGCEVTAKPDGTISVRPANGQPRTLPPNKYKRITINGECYIQFETPEGPYCIPCDVEKGYAVSCDEMLQENDKQPSTVDIGGFGYDTSFTRFVSKMLAQEGVEQESQAILAAYGYDTWLPGDIAGVPLALEKLDTNLNSISIYVISRSDWEWPDNGSGSNLVGLFLGDPTDGIPDAVIFRVRGTLEEVTDSIGAVFADGLTWQDTFDGQNIELEIFPIGEGRYQGFLFLDGELVWQRRE